MKSLILFVVLFASSCASINLGEKKREPTPELKMAVIGVADQYLGAITADHYDHLRGMVLWVDYSAANSMITKVDYEREIRILNETFKPASDEHPLKQLEVTDINVNENDATVKLKKIGFEQEFDINLRWIGEGWLVVDDSIFGATGYLSKY